jgi:hypothetical protein
LPAWEDPAIGVIAKLDVGEGFPVGVFPSRAVEVEVWVGVMLGVGVRVGVVVIVGFDVRLGASVDVAVAVAEGVGVPNRVPSLCAR